MSNTNDKSLEYQEFGTKCYKEKNFSEAIWWYEKASNLGNISAKYNLASMYYDLATLIRTQK